MVVTWRITPPKILPAIFLLSFNETDALWSALTRAEEVCTTMTVKIEFGGVCLNDNELKCPFLDVSTPCLAPNRKLG